MINLSDLSVQSQIAVPKDEESHLAGAFIAAMLSAKVTAKTQANSSDQPSTP